MSNVYIPLKGLCTAYEWAVAQVMSNSLAATCGHEALLTATPDDKRKDWDEDQMAFFCEVYDNPIMREVITGKDADGEKAVTLGYWPTYRQERDAGKIESTAAPWDD